MSLGPWFKCYPGDFLQGMRDMEPVTQAFYVQLIFRMYETADAIYADERQIGRWCNSNARPWRKVREQLIEQGRLVELPDGGIINQRALEEMVEQAEAKHVPAFIRERLAKVSEMFRESFGKDSRKIRETSPKKPTETKPLKEPEPEDTLDSHADGPSISEIRSACLQAAGMTDADLTPAMIAPTPIVHLIRPASGEPCDLQLDVIPAIQSCAASLRQRGQTLKAWSYCREAIIRNRDARLSGAPAVEHRPGARPSQRPASTASARKHAERDARFDALVDQLENGMGGQDSPEDYGSGGEPGGSESRVIELDRTQFARITGTDR